MILMREQHVQIIWNRWGAIKSNIKHRQSHDESVVDLTNDSRENLQQNDSLLNVSNDITAF